MTGTDQANALRALVRRADGAERSNECQVIAMTSGKGGVGKSTLSLLFARAFALQGRKVLLLDGDLGLANLHILLGLTPKYSLSNLLSGDIPADQVIIPVCSGVDLLPGSSGSALLADLPTEKLRRLFLEIDQASSNYDIILIDGGAGIGERAIRLSLIADTVVTVITPDPTSLADGYAALKVLQSQGADDLRVVVNQVESDAEAEALEEKLHLLTDRFLSFKPQIIGRLPRDRRLASAIRSESSIFVQKGLAEFSLRMNAAAASLLGTPSAGVPPIKKGLLTRIFHKEERK